MNTMKQLIVLSGLAAFLVFASCASSPEPFEYEQNNELRPGPGLLTGEDGVYTIYGKPTPEKNEEPEAEEVAPAKLDAQ